MAEHVARCQCGGIEVRAGRDPDVVVACNCKACQRRTGAAFGAAGYWPEEALRISGESRSWRRVADSRLEFVTYFCPTCGTSVWWTLGAYPGRVGVAYGCFEAALPEPARVVWTEEQHAWVRFPDAMPRFERGTSGR